MCVCVTIKPRFVNSHNTFQHDHYISKEVRGIYLCVFCAMNCNMCLPWDTKKTSGYCFFIQKNTCLPFSPRIVIWGKFKK